MIRFLILCAMVALALSLAWAAACGPADLGDDDLWPDQERGRR